MSLINAKLQDKLLADAQQMLEARITDPATREAFAKVVNAGMQVTLHNAGGLDKLTEAQDPVAAAALGAANLVLLMWKQSTGTKMPFEVIPPATITLMLQALDFLDKAKIHKPTIEDIKRGMGIAVDRIMAAVGVTPAMFGRMAAAVNGVVSDPAKLEVIKRRAGVVMDPMASSPTVVPQAPPSRGKGLIDGI